MALENNTFSRAFLWQLSNLFAIGFVYKECSIWKYPPKTWITIAGQYPNPITLWLRFLEEYDFYFKRRPLSLKQKKSLRIFGEEKFSKREHGERGEVIRDYLRGSTPSFVYL